MFRRSSCTLNEPRLLDACFGNLLSIILFSYMLHFVVSNFKLVRRDLCLTKDSEPRGKTHCLAHNGNAFRFVGLIGLRNMGNTCYMNSVLQALSNCPPLTEFMRVCWNACVEKEEMDKNRSVCIASEFRTLLSIRLSHPGFRVHQQQVAIGIYVMNFFCLTLLPDRGLSTTSELIDILCNYFSKSFSALTEIFNGRLLSSVKCLHCQRVSEMDEVFQDLSLPIPSRQQLEYLAASADGTKALLQEDQEDIGWFISGVHVTLNDCFSTFFSPDSLSGDDMYQCGHCAKLRNGVKVCKLLELPEVSVLCLHVKRFRHDSYSSKKIGTMIQFPLHGLDLKQFVTTYDLIAVISHSGVTEGGHYIAYCFNHLNCQWYSFDDEVVGRVDPYVVENVQAYILFYQKTSNLMDSLRLSAGRLYEEFVKEVVIIVVNCLTSILVNDSRYLLSEKHELIRWWLCKFEVE
ncbi:UCH domain containing protein [Trichuris trichiura]|uniref:Ubiquitin carboxyl-terminal hydrolase n=1 Tax=Trichuris trichiura TaxID=36087 RepID=A0A077Z4C6_TRITR|nr:UCH domain containing protein [Trichuris trichiura]